MGQRAVGWQADSERHYGCGRRGYRGNMGIDAIIVSNHGGRQLDGAPASIEVLPEIVAAVNGACEVWLDGGIRSGQDVFKAKA